MRLGSLGPRDPELGRGGGARESGHQVVREPNFVPALEEKEEYTRTFGAHFENRARRPNHSRSRTH